LNNNIFFNVDLGTVRDPTAITIISREMVALDNVSTRRETRENERHTFQSMYRVRYMDRLPLGMDYPEQIERVRGMMAHKDLVGKAELIIDATGVGLPVLHMMNERGLSPVGIWITAGNKTSRRPDGFNVPKRTLVSTLNLIFQSRRLKIPYGLKQRAAFMKELEGFTMKMRNSGADTYEAETESVHDDLVMSMALGVWYAEENYGGLYSPLKDDRQVIEMKDPLEYGM